MRRISVCCFVSLFILLPVSFVFTQTRGELELIASNGSVIGTFSQGYALVIGEINYNNGWGKLNSIRNEVNIVKGLLEGHNFIVETLIDKTSDELQSGIQNFLKRYGLRENARLVVFFAGHGATYPLEGKDVGYIVPIDAPTYKDNQEGFFSKAIPMEFFQTWANNLRCRHILFIFDSCFSGTIFTTRSETLPPSISYDMVKPVRQFITAGSEDETTPPVSVLVPLLERALKDGEADLDKDGYITGTELGMYLQKQIIDRYKGSWHPQYGKSHDTRWDKGDFIFKNPVVVSTPPSQDTKSSVAVGSVTVESDIAGEIIIDGKPSGTIKAGGTITINNVSTGNTEVAVKEIDGTIIKAPVIFVRQGQTVTAVIERPIPEGLIYEIIDGKSVTITKYTGNATVINIPDRIQRLPVTVIGNSAFNTCQYITSINLPSSITTIGNYAFHSCQGLTSINIPSLVKTIGKHAFDGCYSLENITVDSHNLAYTSIDGVLFDKNIKTIIRYPSRRKAETYNIPSSVITIDDSAFSSCNNLTRVYISYPVTMIGKYAFNSCNNLISINIPSSVTTIDDCAFTQCESLTKINIPSSVKTIGQWALHTGSLESINVENSNPVYTSIDGILFDKNIKTIISYPSSRKTETYNIPSSVTTIGDNAFYCCENLFNVVIPSSVTTIDGFAFYWCKKISIINIPSLVTMIKSDSFYGTDNLENINVDSQNATYKSIDGVLFDKNLKTILHYPAGKKSHTYSIPSSVTTIGTHTFDGDKLTSVNIPSSVTVINNSAFDLDNLTNISIPSSVTTIYDAAFYYCDRLATVTMSQHTKIEGRGFPETTKIIYRD